jgi:pyridoxal phosphate enzyme (YggS family)
MSVSENLKRVRERIEKAAYRARRGVGEIRLVAVTKGVNAERIIEAAGLGINAFGENYAQEFRDKRDLVEKAIGREVEWHFIGRLQKNKVKYLDGVSLIHSLDSASVAQEINKRAEKLETNVPVLIEVNIGEEGVKGGIKSRQLDDFLSVLSSFLRIEVNGLMTMPPFFDNPEMVRPYFRKLRELRDRLQERFPKLRELSMGMSGDFDVAIEEGATIVRIGTAIFGPRSN